MTDLSALSTAALIALYNQHAAKPVTRFETRKVGEKRVAALLAAADGDEKAPKQIDADVAIPDNDGEPVYVEPASGPTPATLGAAAAKADDAERARIAAEVRAECDAMHEEPVVETAAASLAAAKAPKTAPVRPATLSRPAVGALGFAALGGLATFTGSKLALLRMMQRVDGVSAEQAAKELGWARCGATLSRVIKAATAAGIEVVKVRGEDRTMRYVATRLSLA